MRIFQIEILISIHALTIGRIVLILVDVHDLIEYLSCNLASCIDLLLVLLLACVHVVKYGIATSSVRGGLQSPRGISTL